MLTEEILGYGGRARRSRPTPALIAAAIALQLTIAAVAVSGHEAPARRPSVPLRAPDPAGRFFVGAVAPDRVSALHAARSVAAESCPGGSPASDESFRAEGGFDRLVYTVWIERELARARRFVVVLSWRDGSYDYRVTNSAGCG